MIPSFPNVRTPSVDELIALAADFGMTLEPALAASYRELIAEGIESYTRIDALPEPALPVAYPRGPGHRPAPEENPHNAWYWRCEVRGARHGPLAGKTIALKDNICLAGVPMSIGASVIEGYVPEVDAAIVTRILDAGGTITGKAVCGAFCLEGSSITASTGLVSNPHKTSHAAGGSSSGSAALVAAGAVDLAVGTDQGGSLRIPAAWCGLYGMKPTFGLVPYSGIASIEFTLDHAGPMAAGLEDMTRLLRAMAGPDGIDPRQPDFEPPDYPAALDGGVRGLRIACLAEGFGRPESEPVVDRKVRAALQRFAALGAEVRTTSLPMHAHGMHIWAGIAREGAAQNMLKGGGVGVNQQGYQITSLLDASARALRRQPDDLAPTVTLTLLFGEYMGRNYHGRYYAKAQNLRRTLRAAYDTVLAEHDLIALPTTAMRARPLPDPLACTPAQYEHDAHDALMNPCPFDASGHPALTIPCGAADDLPIGLSLVGKHFDESTLLRAAAAFADAEDWRTL